MDSISLNSNPPSNSDSNDESCPICLVAFDKNVRTVVATECNHKFDKDCLDTWLQQHSTCPMCRKSLRQRNITAANATDLANLSPEEQYDVLLSAIRMENENWRIQIRELTRMGVALRSEDLHDTLLLAAHTENNHWRLQTTRLVGMGATLTEEELSQVPEERRNFLSNLLENRE